eukprot:TRINITY_DN26808_c0_g1_i1.p1 TRINITY_DN26808_c0_g1~~TRINITY_DN26808_c0_g1_i1.p1  ORF type:complete len:550 (+),score=185.86 TRINITY_DN26808_c0_g1_i1:53-1651(+)
MSVSPTISEMAPLSGMGEAYLAFDTDIQEWTRKLRHHPEQAVFAGRARVYREKAMAARARSDRVTALGALKLAAGDLTTALSQGDRGQIAKAEWFHLRGEVSKQIAGLLERGQARRLALEDAVRDLSDSLLIDHTQVDVLTSRAETYLTLVKYELAADDFTAVLSRTAVAASRIRAFVGRAEASAGLNFHEDAVADYSTALQLTMGQEAVDSQTLADVLYSRSQRHDALGSTEQCLADLSKALELCPEHLPALETRAILCYELGMYTESEEDLTDALQLGGANSAQLGELFRKLQKVHSVTIHIVGATDVTAADLRPQAVCDYSVVPCQALSVRALVEGRTLRSCGTSSPEWDEVIELDVPDLAYKLVFSVRDDDPSADAEFLGRCEIPLPQQPSSGGTVGLPLRPRTQRRTDIRVFESLTGGGKGILRLAWHVRRKFDRHPAKVTTKAQIQADVSGVLCDGDNLRQLFKKFDVDGNGWLSRQEVRSIYNAFDSLGAPEEDVDKVLDKYAVLADGKVTFDEFAILMLRISQR